MTRSVSTDRARTPREQRRDWLLAVAGAVVLADALDAPIAALVGRDATVLPNVPIARLPLLVVGVAAALLLAGSPRRALWSVRSAWPVWPAVALAFASTAWSDQPRKTLLWALALLATTAFGIALDRRFSARAQALLVAEVVSAIAVLSVIAAALFTTNQISLGGRWSGLYLQKNLLGRVMALGVAASAVTISGARRRHAAAAALLLCGGVLVATRSAASMLAAGITFAATASVVVARAHRRIAPAILVTGAVTTIAAVLTLVDTNPGLRLMARSETFSERTRIWRAVAAGGAEDPWFGHGYGAFWTGPGGRKALAVIRIAINHAHNGALDLYAELGIAGLTVVLVPLAWAGFAAVQHVLRANDTACLWPAAYVVFFAASNVAESALLRHKLYWALFVAVVCHLIRHRSARAAPSFRPGTGADAGTAPAPAPNT